MVTIKWGNRYFSVTSSDSEPVNAEQKIYIANEWDSLVTVIDASDNTVIQNIELSQQYYAKYLRYSAHNVQVSPDGSIVAVTANIMEPEEEEEHIEENINYDQVILIDPVYDTIKTRIDTDKGAHLAHVVINNDATNLYAASQDKSTIYDISLKTEKIEKIIKLPDGAQPHGMRLSVDGKLLFVALIGEQGMAVIDTDTYDVEIIPLGDKAIQSAVSPDGRYAFVSLYMTKRVVRYDIAQKKVDYIELPEEAYGPVQIYPTPDSKYLYVADQWYYFDKPTGNKIYKIDIEQKKVVDMYLGGEAPHGVVVGPSGEKVYVTNLLSDTLSVIDTRTNRVTDTIDIEKTPNGISIRTKGEGGTP